MSIVLYFIAAFCLLVLAFVIFRVFVHRDYRQKGRLTGLSLLLELLIFALHANFSYLYLPAEWPALPLLPDSLLQKTVGLLLIAAGLLAVLVGMAGLGVRQLFGQAVDEIHQAGLYRLTRNPQILAYGVMVVGWGVLWPSGYALGWMLLYGVIAHLMVLTEEEHLRQVGGEAYERYCEQVPRYVPFFGRK